MQQLSSSPYRSCSSLPAQAGRRGSRSVPSRCIRPAAVCRAAAADGVNNTSSSSTTTTSSSIASSSSSSSRRATTLALFSAAASAAAVAAAPRPARAEQQQQKLSELEPMDALRDKDYGKPRMKYGDFSATPSGLQYLDIKQGEGGAPSPGQTCVVDWSGYTIGYYGRPFEARNKPKGSSFTGDNKDFYRFKLGSGSVIPGFDEAVAGMRVGGIRRVVVPVELGYPNGDFKKTGPKPSTFAGERALDFVLSNRGMIDKTLMFDIELMRVD